MKIINKKFPIASASIALFLTLPGAMSAQAKDSGYRNGSLAIAVVARTGTKPDSTITPNISTEPTQIYRIGAGDLLSIDIKNVPGQAKFVRVRVDGTIDFPLAGEDLIIEGKTSNEAETLIAGRVKLVADANVTVHVREYTSHIVSVWGLVDRPGEQQIQRDAIPFFVIRAGTGIDSRADRVRITRISSTKTVEFALSDNKLGSVLIYPGDSIEFAGDGGKSND